jgi:hypothetical protein
VIPDFDKLKITIYRGCHRQFLLDVDESGKTKIERQLEESQRQLDALLDAETDMLLNPTLATKKDAKPKRSSSTSRGGTRPKRSSSTASKTRRSTKEPTRPSSSMGSRSAPSRRPRRALHRETAVEACERVLKEIEEDSEPIKISPLVIDLGVEDEEEPIVLPPIEDEEEEFFMSVPE